MATETLNRTSSQSYNSGNVRGNIIDRLAANLSGADIAAITPFCNDGWYAEDDCLKIRKPNDISDLIIGITIDAIDDGSITNLKYICNGFLTGIDTSSWSIDDLLYVKTDATLTNDVTADPANTIPQEVAVVIRSDASEGEIYISAVASQVQYVRMALSEVLGLFLVKNSGDESKFLKLYHDGSNGFIEPDTGILKTNDVDLDVGTAVLKGSGALLSGLTISQIVETDADKKLISVAKGTAYNKTFGDTTANIPAIGTDLSASQIVETDANKKLISAAKGTAYNKDFGDTTANIPAIGTDLSASQIVETDANKKLISVAKGTAYNKSFGTGSGEVAQGNDSRINNGQTAYGWGNHASAGYEPGFSKNTAFNKDFGTGSGEVAQGNDSRINNGQTAYGWGDHSTAGYLTEESDPTISFSAVSHIYIDLEDGSQLMFNYRTMNFGSSGSQNVLTGVSYTPPA